MLNAVQEWWQAMVHMVYPNLCKGCSIDLPQTAHPLCAACLSNLPLTGFENHSGNASEKLFYGRVKIEAAMSLCYFTQQSLVQSLIHQVKYEGAKSLGIYMGKLIGRALLNNPRFGGLDLLVPLPLTPGREKQRGYNQSALLAEGISAVTGVPMTTQAMARLRNQGTQTHKSREERWQQMHHHFSCPKPALLAHKSILLVDDVITTGATLDACTSAISGIPGIKTSIATLAMAMK